MAERKLNGPHARELGEINATLKSINRTLERWENRDEDQTKRITALETKVAVTRERLFVLGAIIALVSGYGGGVINEHWSKTAMSGIGHERPYEKSPQPVDLAAYHPDERASRVYFRGNVPER